MSRTMTLSEDIEALRELLGVDSWGKDGWTKVLRAARSEIRRLRKDRAQLQRRLEK